MRHHLIRLAVGLATFVVGVCAATLFVGAPRPAAVRVPGRFVASQQADAQTAAVVADLCERVLSDKDISDEDKAVLAAQSFVLLEGYTGGEVSGSNMPLPCFEGEGVGEEGYAGRYDTIDSRAYGLSRLRRRGEKGWTVVFRYSDRLGGARMKTGRAVTMDEHFKNLRVEHCDFILDKVGKKL